MPKIAAPVVARLDVEPAAVATGAPVVSIGGNDAEDTGGITSASVATSGSGWPWPGHLDPTPPPDDAGFASDPTGNCGSRSGPRWVVDKDGDLMKAVTWQGKRDVRVAEVPDPRIELPTDAIVKITSSAICGSDLHLYEVLGPYMKPGDILGHEPMGVVQEVGAEVTDIAVGDRVVIPFNISCGHCFMCSRGLQSQCETTQVREQNKGAALFGFSAMYGSVPGGQAEYLRVPQAQYGPIKVSPDGPDERYLFLSDILPTAWQSVVYANPPEGGTLAVFGLGPVGQFAARIGKHWGRRVIGVDVVPERRDLAARHGIEVIDPSG
jgi:threonine dehydrogenase-like Zn-dependent dehydrogenase